MQIKEKDREIKRLKEEAERQRKLHQDRLKQANEEVNQVREELETEFREKYEDQMNKNKREKDKAVEKAVEKVRADLRNQLDNVKNEFAKAKADWARDRKRLVSDHENNLNSQKKEAEIEREAELRAHKEKIEKQWRKKLDDREKALEERIGEIDIEMNDMR